MRVLVLEDIPETRAWLIVVVAQAFPEAAPVAVDKRAAGVTAAKAEAFDLALIDLGLPDGSGLDVLREVNAKNPEALCVVTIIMNDDEHILAALSAEAKGYLLKDQPEAVLVRQLRQQAEGVPALLPRIARRIMEHFRHTASAADDASVLTEREADVLGLIGRGLRNAEVAAELGLSENTVAGYIKAIYRKLDISSRAEASWHANRLGLLWKK